MTAASLRAETARAARVVELVGPAGAGKSTVRALVRSALDDGGPATPEGRTRARSAMLAARHASEWLPAAVGLLATAPRIGRPLLRHLVRVRTLAAELPRLGAAGAPVLFDEGPVFSLARVSRACEQAPLPALARYLEASLAVWGATLGAIVYLDAPDAVLARRINGRAKAHRVKGRPDAELRAFLAWYRRHYASLLQDLAGRGVRIVRVDTARHAPAAVAARVQALLSERSRAR